MEFVWHPLGSGVDRADLAGRLDSAGAQAIEARMKSAIATATGSVVVDLSQVPFLGSLGIRVLLSGAQALRRRGGTMVLLQPQPLVEEVLRMTGIEALLPIQHDLDAALAALRGPA